MEQPGKKQIGRYLRYKLAFDRLDEALVEGWLLEAISLEESIITDRLLSIVGSDGDAASCRQSLSNLIAQAKKAMTGSGATVEGDIFNELDKWRDARNECVHAFCKLDDHAYADNSAEIFSEKNVGDSQERARARRPGEVSVNPGQERPTLSRIGIIQPEEPLALSA